MKTTNSEEMSYDSARELAVRVIGYYFTVTFIAALKNPKIRNFCDEAESCYQKLKKWNAGKFWTCIWALDSLGLFWAAAIQLKKYGWVEGALHGWAFSALMIGGIGFALIDLACASSRLYNRPGDTTRLVAKVWKPWRKKTIAMLAYNLTINIQRRYDGSDSADSAIAKEIRMDDYCGPELKRVLKSVLDDLARQTADSFKTAECDGIERDRRRLRNKFGALGCIYKILGFEPLDWDMLCEQKG